MFNIPFAAFLVSSALYAIIAGSCYMRVKSLNDFYHTKVERNGVVVLVLGNLTLGTGLVYVSQVGASQGVAAFLAPVGVLLGYFILAAYSRRLESSFCERPDCKSYLDFIHDLPSSESGAKRLFRAYIVLQSIVFSMLCAFELYASSGLLARIINFGLTPESRLTVSLTLLFVAIGYTSAGGMRATVNTDWVQALFVVVSLIILFGVVCMFADNPAESFIDHSLRNVSSGESLSLVAVLSAFAVMYNAVTTQFYSVLNVSVSTNYETKGKVRVFKKTGCFVAVTLCIFVVIGMIAPRGLNADMEVVLAELLSSFSVMTGAMPIALASVMTAGFVALLLSTLDGTLVVIQQSLWEVVSPGKTFSLAESSKDVEHARYFNVATGCVIGFFLWLFVVIDAEIVSLVLTVIWPLSFWAPIFAISAFFAAKKKRTLLALPVTQRVLLVITAVLWLALFTLTAKHVDVTAWASVVSFCAAIGYGILDLRHSRLTCN